jgi:hypothetical protein
MTYDVQTEINKFFEVPAIKAELKPTQENLDILLKWLAAQKIQVYEQTLTAAFIYCKPQLELIPVEATPKLKPAVSNIGIDSGAPTGHYSHSQRIRDDAAKEAARQAQAAKDKAALDELGRKIQQANTDAANTVLARRAKVPPRL